MDDFGMIMIATLIKVGFMMIIVGWIPALIAHRKGRNFFLWWIYGGALFIIALIHSLLITTHVSSARPADINLGKGVIQ